MLLGRPVVGGGVGGVEPPPEIFKLEIFRQKFSNLNYVSATKVEFCYYNRQLSMEATVSKYCRSSIFILVVPWESNF